VSELLTPGCQELSSIVRLENEMTGAHDGSIPKHVFRFAATTSGQPLMAGGSWGEASLCQVVQPACCVPLLKQPWWPHAARHPHIAKPDRGGSSQRSPQSAGV